MLAWSHTYHLQGVMGLIASEGQCVRITFCRGKKETVHFELLLDMRWPQKQTLFFVGQFI